MIEINGYALIVCKSPSTSRFWSEFFQSIAGQSIGFDNKIISVKDARRELRFLQVAFEGDVSDAYQIFFRWAEPYRHELSLVAVTDVDGDPITLENLRALDSMSGDNYLGWCRSNVVHEFIAVGGIDAFTAEDLGRILYVCHYDLNEMVHNIFVKGISESSSPSAVPLEIWASVIRDSCDIDHSRVSLFPVYVMMHVIAACRYCDRRSDHIHLPPVS